MDTQHSPVGSAAAAMTAAGTTTTAPQARRQPTERTHHGDTFVDQYEWLRAKDSSEVIDHLTAENAYTDAVAAPLEDLRQSIFQEIKARTKETDLSVPHRRDQFWYFSRTIEGQQYRAHSRVPALTTGDDVQDWTPPSVEPGVPMDGEQVILDGNALTEGQPFFSLGGFDLSADGRCLAYSVDNAGDERYTVFIKDLTTGELLPDRIEETSAGLIITPDARHLFYIRPDDSWRPFQVFRHTIGSSEPDVLIFEEPDQAMWTGMGLSGDRQELVLEIGNSEVTEIRVLPLSSDSPAHDDAAPRVVLSRSEGILASVDPLTIGHSRAYLVTHNREGANNSVSLVLADQLDKPLAEQAWITVVPHRDDVKVDGTGVTDRWVLVAQRENTTPGFVAFARHEVEALLTGSTEADLMPLTPEFAEEIYSVQPGSMYESPYLTLAFNSYVTPQRVLLYNPASGETSVLKETEAPGVDLSAYESIRDWAVADDGTRVPLTIIKRKDTPRDGTAPGLVYGYGSYEASMDPYFSSARLSLLDRGVVWVTAHVRGGGELGRAWYTGGKKLEKKHTFTDFIASTRHVAEAGWVDGSRVAAMGGSAGGLLMGAITNMAPELYRAVVAQVPFVDALTTILDPDLPLSALEWEEWGNPIEDKEVYDYMKSYTPYENVRPAAYPAVAALTSLNDTRVLYVEPAKWVQVLRENQQGPAPIVLKTEMDGGHGGASGRYEGWKDFAWDAAWILGHLGATERVAD
jgi:oligopeptidase B